MNKRFSAIAVFPIACAFVTAAPAAAAWATADREPAPEPVRTQQVDDWPDEGSGYPGYADDSGPALAPAASVDQENGLQVTSVVVGALGGIGLGGAALGVTLVVQRRRDRMMATLKA
jgi:hypothetical protein